MIFFPWFYGVKKQVFASQKLQLFRKFWNNVRPGFNFEFRSVIYVMNRVGSGHEFTDLAAHLTQDVLLRTDQRLLKPVFDIWKTEARRPPKVSK